MVDDSVGCSECPSKFPAAVNAVEACETNELRPLKKAKLVVDEKCSCEGEGDRLLVDFVLS